MEKTVKPFKMEKDGQVKIVDLKSVETMLAEKGWKKVKQPKEKTSTEERNITA